MKKVMKWLLMTGWLFALFCTRENLADTLGFRPSNLVHPGSPILQSELMPMGAGSVRFSLPTAVDSLFIWDDDLLDWVAIGPYSASLEAAALPVYAKNNPDAPVKVDWEMLQNIKYRLKYFPAFEMPIYAPVFSKTVKALDGKVVDIEGFVIPFEEDDEQLPLSANPYASCFFCGQAGPASIISVRLLKSGKRFKLDAFQSFRGRLRLNHDDPNEFYYILEEARPLP